MDSVSKQRLVGTLVLIALGVVFWPIIFVEPDSVQPIVLEPMPLQPTIDESPLPVPDNPEERISPQLKAPQVDPAAQAAADKATLLAAEDADTGDSADQDTTADISLPEASQLDPPRPRTEAPEPVLNDAAGFAVSWVLQVAAVSSEQHARDLVERLKAKGYEAFFRRVKRDSRPLWRVQIGPKLERDKFAPIKTEIDRVLQVDSTIIRYVQ